MKAFKMVTSALLTLYCVGALAEGVSDPGLDVIVVQTITADTGVPVRFIDAKKCIYVGELTHNGEAWLAQLDRQICPDEKGDLVKHVSFVVPLGRMTQAVCSGTRLGMFSQNVGLPMKGPAPNADTLAQHQLEAAQTCP